MTDFTPLEGLVGGALIGLAAAYLLVVNGRIAGVSGIFSGLLSFGGADVAWRLLFVLGLILGAAASLLLWPGEGASVSITAGWPVLVIGGLLVGVGTRIGNGCTSGHGVCGIPRLSKRSITATAIFFSVAALTVFVVRHVI